MFSYLSLQEFLFRAFGLFSLSDVFFDFNLIYLVAGNLMRR